jgi:midasin
MIEYNARLSEEVVLKRTFARLGSPWEFNLRDVIRWGILLRTAGPSGHPAEYLRSTYLHRFRTVSDRNHARLLFDKIFSIVSQNFDRIPHVSISSSFVQVGRLTIPRANAPPLSRPGCLLQAHHSALESAGHCVIQSWPVIITGSHGSGKTEVVRALANITGNYLQEISINSATDAMDILGSFEQVDNRERIVDVIRCVLSLAHEVFRDASGCSVRRSNDYYALRKAIEQSSTFDLSDALRSASNLLELGDLISPKKSEFGGIKTEIHELLILADRPGRFEWVDGPLVRALKRGYWLLLEGANLCSPSVLDRLNSLCEPDGFLTLSEKGYVSGSVQTIKPHPNFRLFMTVDPQYGELSRAMRNRGLEIALVNHTTTEDQQRLQYHFSLPLVSTSVHRTLFPAEFESVRRGLVLPNMQHQRPSDWPSGRITYLDSASSNLIDLAPFLSISFSDSQDALNASLHLLSRATLPTYIPYISRFLSAPELGTHVGRSRIREALLSLIGNQLRLPPFWSRIRQKCSSLWGVPSDLAQAQVSLSEPRFAALLL